MDNRRKTRVLGVTMSPGNNSMVVLLEEESGDRVLPIWIGEFEGSNIEMALRGIQPPRPFPYDLMLNLITQLGSTVNCVTVISLRENTFFAEVDIVRDGKHIILDSRPSDAIAIALRSQAPIYVNEDVLEQAAMSRRVLRRILGTREEPAESPEEEIAQFKEFLSRIRPEEFRGFLGEESGGESGEEGSEPQES